MTNGAGGIYNALFRLRLSFSISSLYLLEKKPTAIATPQSFVAAVASYLHRVTFQRKFLGIRAIATKSLHPPT